MEDVTIVFGLRHSDAFFFFFNEKNWGGGRKKIFG